jgi:UDPglucose--hexose-1-phosphate uridylyltransferase
VPMAGITRRAARLSDGRELIYFDDADTTLEPGRAVDARPPVPRPPVPTMRQDPLTGEWISIASARQDRALLPPDELDPLAPATKGNPTEVPSNYDVVVFENKSPAFGPLLPEPGYGPDDQASPDALASLEAIGLGRARPGFGRCEVVCFGPQRSGSFAGLGVSRVRTVVEAWADRTAELSALPGVQQVFIFENRGEAIGVTLHHPHGQIYAYPYITPKTGRLLAAIEAYGPKLLADILEHEQQSERVLIRGEHFTVFVPFAARWPIEVHMLPHRHVPDFAATSPAERDELAILYRRTLRALDLLYDTPTPYIAAWHQAPLHRGRDDIRLMLQVTSPRRGAAKLKYLAGSESAMGAFIGDIVPEVTAERLRAALAVVAD